MTTQSAQPQITAENPNVKKWIGKGEILSSKMNPKYGELFLVVKHVERLSFIRCFWIGGNAAVSVDFQGDAISMVSHLMEQYVG